MRLTIWALTVLADLIEGVALVRRQPAPMLFRVQLPLAIAHHYGRR